jgi:release factor glutamine methyltransferase
MTLGQALHQLGTAYQLERLDAQLLLLLALQRPSTDRAWLLAHVDDVLPPHNQADLLALAQRRASGEPLAYIAGCKEFFGLSLQVNPHVLVPRPDTETLVQWALDLLAQRPNASVLDLGTGSGAIALALKSKIATLKVHAIDFSAQALALAESNARKLQLSVHFAQGNWLDEVQGDFDAIVSNPPYIAEHDEHLENLRFEPLLALTGGHDGLQDIREIVQRAPGHLKPGGWLLLEHGHDQGPRVRELMQASGLQDVASRLDLAGIERCTLARRAAR